jgi:uncharacterized protein YjbI with pentapeptide repeats
MLNKIQTKNLQNADFHGQNLTGEDFSNADIRGANFSSAILVGANFSNAKAGLPLIWKVGLIILSLILSLFAGLIAGYAGAFIGDLLSGRTYGHTTFGIISLISLISFLIIIFWQGLGGTLATLAELIAAFLIATLAFLPDTESKLIDSLIVGAVFTVIGLAGSLAGLVNMALAIAIARVMVLPKIRAIIIFMASFGIILGALLGVRSQVSAYFISGIVGLAAITLGAYVGWQAISGNKKYALIRTLAVGIVCQGGTKFYNADLTDANFTQATLKNVDFRNAILTRTCWFGVKQLDQARINSTYLKDVRIRQLVITKDGRDAGFDYLDLRGLNLKDANLKNASLVGADLSLSDLENANLSGAKLARTQLYQANLNHADLTGAYIQNWGISTDTQLDEIKCEYIYMRLPTKDDPDPCRKPDNRNEVFKEGDFSDFISPIIKTLDLYQTQNIDPRKVASKFKTLDLFHYEGIDPTAAAIAITQLADNYPEAALEIVSLEGRGNEKIRLQAVVAGGVNRSELYNEYFKTYSEIKSLPYNDLQSLLIGIKEKDDRIRSLENLLGNAIHQPKFYVETYQTQGDFNMSQQNKGNVNISGTQGNISGVAAAGENQTMTGVAIGAISGNVTNTINQLPDTENSDEPGIKELLTQLQNAIETDINLSDDDKAEALEELQKIAEVGQKQNEAGMQKSVKKSLIFLKGIISGLPSAVELVKTFGAVLPLVAKFFGLP